MSCSMEMLYHFPHTAEMELPVPCPFSWNETLQKRHINVEFTATKVSLSYCVLLPFQWVVKWPDFNCLTHSSQVQQSPSCPGWGVHAPYRFAKCSLSMLSKTPGLPINTPMRAAEVRMWTRREGENAWPDCICMTDPLAYTVSIALQASSAHDVDFMLPRYDMRRWNPPKRTITFPRSWEEATISAALMYEGWLNVTAHILKLYVFHIVTVQSIVPCRRYSDWRGLNWWRAEFQFSYWSLCMATFMKPIHEGQSSCCSAQDVYLFTWATLPVFIRSHSNTIGNRNDLVY